MKEGITDPVDINLDLREAARALSVALGEELSLNRLAAAISLASVRVQDAQKAFDELAEVLEKYREKCPVEAQKASSGAKKPSADSVKSLPQGRKIRIRGGKNGRSAPRKAL